MKEFKGKKWHIAHTHYMGKAGSLSWGGGKTKEFNEWEEFFKWYENAKRYGLIPDRRRMSMRAKERV